MAPWSDLRRALRSLRGPGGQWLLSAHAMDRLREGERCQLAPHQVLAALRHPRRVWCGYSNHDLRLHLVLYSVLDRDWYVALVGAPAVVVTILSRAQYEASNGAIAVRRLVRSRQVIDPLWRPDEEERRALATQSRKNRRTLWDEALASDWKSYVLDGEAARQLVLISRLAPAQCLALANRAPRAWAARNLKQRTMRQVIFSAPDADFLLLDVDIAAGRILAVTARQAAEAVCGPLWPRALAMARKSAGVDDLPKDREQGGPVSDRPVLVQGRTVTYRLSATAAAQLTQCGRLDAATFEALLGDPVFVRGPRADGRACVIVYSAADGDFLLGVAHAATGEIFEVVGRKEYEARNGAVPEESLLRAKRRVAPDEVPERPVFLTVRWIASDGKIATVSLGRWPDLTLRAGVAALAATSGLLDRVRAAMEAKGRAFAFATMLIAREGRDGLPQIVPVTLPGESLEVNARWMGPTDVDGRQPL